MDNTNIISCPYSNRDLGRVHILQSAAVPRLLSTRGRDNITEGRGQNRRGADRGRPDADRGPRPGTAEATDSPGGLDPGIGLGIGLGIGAADRDLGKDPGLIVDMEGWFWLLFATSWIYSYSVLHYKLL